MRKRKEHVITRKFFPYQKLSVPWQSRISDDGSIGMGADARDCIVTTAFIRSSDSVALGREAQN
jgi:hypothetical protein